MKKAIVAIVIILLANTARPAKLKTLTLNEIKAAGWIKNQMERDITSGYISIYDQIQPSMKGNVFGKVKAKNYSIDKDGNWIARRETWWPGEHEGYFADLVVRNAFLTNNKAWKEKAKKILDNVIDSQESNGYIGIYDEECRLDNLLNENGELWTQSRMICALLAYYEYSGEKRYFDAAKKAVDYTIMRYKQSGKSYFGQPKPNGGGLTHGLMYAETLEWMWKLTKDKKYSDFAKWLYDDYSKAEPKLKNIDNQLKMLLDKEIMFSEHSVHAVEHARIPFFIAECTKESVYEQATENIFYKLKRSIAPTGTIVTDPIIHESVAGNYGSGDLPYEYCSITEMEISYASAMQKLSKSEFGDYIENLAFNAGQGSRYANGKAIAYLGKDNNYEAVFKEGFRHQYAACHSVACCNLNAAKLMPYYVANMWMKSEDEKDVFLVTYGASEVNTKINNTSVQLIEETMYPFENEVNITINPSAESMFRIVLRNPTWSKKTEVIATGANIEQRNGFIYVLKKWNKNDKISIRFDDKIQVNRFINNEIYISKGALIYALKLEATEIATKDFGNGISNFDLSPANKAKADSIFNQYRMMANPDEKYKTQKSLFVYQKNPNTDKQHPFDSAYGFINTKFMVDNHEIAVSLVPFGSTLLRKTTFKENK